MKKTIFTLVLVIFSMKVFALNIQSNQTQINGNQIHYYHVGKTKNKPNLVMLTGIGTTANFWPKDFVASLSKKYNLYMLDYRSFNTSQNGNDLNYSIKALAKDTNKFIKKLKLKNLYILGWSMGGAVAEQTVFDKENDFKQMFLISPAVPLKSNRNLPKKLKEIPSLKTDSDIYNFVFNNNLYNYNPKNLKYEVTRFINPSISKLFPGDKIYAKQKKYITAWVSNKDNLENFINIHIPTTIFLAKDDDMLNPIDTQKSIGLVNDKSFINIINFNKSGHAIDWDQSQKLANIINNLA